MISRPGKDNFFKTHYDWVAVIVGVLALAGALYWYSGASETGAAAGAAKSGMRRDSETGVLPLKMSAFEEALKSAKKPDQVSTNRIDSIEGSFLVSERRVRCRNPECKAVISANIKKYPECRVCKQKQTVVSEIEFDVDKDGLPDVWEKKHGLNVGLNDADLDKDGDGFTNTEELQAKTDPSDAKSHPDYLDSLRLAMPMRVKPMPFILTRKNKITGGWRVEFYDAKKKNDHGRMGRTISVRFIDNKPSPIEQYGFSVVDFKENSEIVKVKGGMPKPHDISEATLERKDGKIIKLIMSENVKDAPRDQDLEATLVFERGGTKEFKVVEGSTIELHGSKYTIAKITNAAKGGKANVEVVDALGKKRVIEALEQ
jgi:hypothetical protein